MPSSYLMEARQVISQAPANIHSKNTFRTRLGPSDNTGKVPHSFKPYLMRCPGCSYVAQWRHRFAAHLDTCKIGRLKIHPLSSIDYVAQYFKVPAGQVHSLMALLPNTERRDSRQTTAVKTPPRGRTWPQHSALARLLPSQNRYSNPAIASPQRIVSTTGTYHPDPGISSHKNTLILPHKVSNVDGPIDLSLTSVRNKAAGESHQPSVNFSFAPTPVMPIIQNVSQPTMPLQHAATSPTKQATYLCAYCSFRAYSTEHIENHILHAHQQPNRQGFNQPSGTMMIPPKTFTCNHCVYHTSSELCMVRHLLTGHRSKLLPAKAGITGPKLFSCSYCDHYSDESEMIDHMLDHYKNKLPCLACSSCINWKRPVLPTKRKATGQKAKHSVAETVDKQLPPTTDSPAKDQPLSKETPFTCNICRALYLTNDDLQIHLKSHNPTQKPSSLVNQDNSVVSLAATTNSNSVTAPLSATMESTIATTDIVSQPVTYALLTPPSSDSDSTVSVDSVSIVNDITHNTTNGATIQKNNDNFSVSSCEVKPHCDSAAERTSLAPDSLMKQSDSINDHSTPDTAKDTPAVVSQLAQSGCSAKAMGESPTKKRRLSLKIYRNNSGEYESKRYDSPKTPIRSLGASSEKLIDGNNHPPMKLDVRIPLDVLPLRKVAPASTKDKIQVSEALPQVDIQLLARTSTTGNHTTGKEVGTVEQTNIQIPLAILPERTRISLSSKEQDANHSQTVGIGEKSTCIPLVNFNQMSIEINHALNTSPRAPTHATEADAVPAADSTEITENEVLTPGAIEAFQKLNPNKVMANLLKKKLSNIYLKGKQDSSPTHSGGIPATWPAKPIVQGTPKKSRLKPNLQRTPKVVSNHVCTLKDGDFIDLTLEDSSDEEIAGDNCKVQNGKDISVAGDTNVSGSTCEVTGAGPSAGEAGNVGPSDNTDANNIDTSSDIKVRLRNADSSTSVASSSVARADEVDPSTAVSAQEVEFVDAKSKEPVSSPASTSNLKTNLIVPSTSEADVGEAVSDDTNKVTVTSAACDDSITSNQQQKDPSLKLKLSGRSRYTTRRRNGLRLPCLHIDSVNKLDDEDLVVCPFCPKRLLFRLLPAHALFHGSDCEHRCRECNFASSFKWALDTHLPCHRESSPLPEARQITEEEWNSMKGETLSDDEDVEMAQKLIIKEPAPKPPKRQIARKMVTRKTVNNMSTELAATANRKAAVPASSYSSAPERPVPLNKQSAQCTEDFFARMLTERRVVGKK